MVWKSISRAKNRRAHELWEVIAIHTTSTHAQFTFQYNNSNVYSTIIRRLHSFFLLNANLILITLFKKNASEAEIQSSNKWDTH